MDYFKDAFHTLFLRGLLGIAFLFSTSVHASYVENPKTKAFIKEMVKKHGFEEGWLQNALLAAEKKESILKAMSRPAEKTLEWKGYRKIFLTQNRIDLGNAFLKKYKKVFDRAEQELGVPREIVAAIIGVETRYGKNKGGYRVIDALSTLAFDYPPRSKFFTSELEQFFLLSREQGFDPVKLKGSYAGAMGYGQFIPSSYRHYAVDFSHDDVADIIENPVDAIGSVANYFKEHGWKSDSSVVVSRAKVGKKSVDGLLSKKLKLNHSWQELKKAGVTIDQKISPDTPVRLIRLLGESGEEYWVAQRNFYVITRYNHSDLYAMAVYQLSQELKK